MEKVRLIISGYWVAIVLVYLYGDMLRVYSGDMEVGIIEGKSVTQGMWLAIAIIMLLPILMIPVTLSLKMPYVRLVNLIIVPVMILFNLLGLPYKGLYDNFLIMVSIILKTIVFYYAWTWK